MRFRRTVTAAVAALLASSVVTPAAMASTTDEARAHWRQVALDSLTRLQQEKGAGNLGLPAWARGGELRLELFRSGNDCNDPQVQSAIDKLLAMKMSSPNSRGRIGYDAQQGDYDRFGDGTVTTAEAVYTVTQADHVGPAILEAVQAGCLPASELYFVIDSLMNQPLETVNAPGAAFDGHRCMMYDDDPNEKYYCVNNVNMGAAAFLKETADLGYSRAGQVALANELAETSRLMYEGGADGNYYKTHAGKDGDGNHLSETVKNCYWPYGYADPYAPMWNTGGTGGFWRDDEDWNHASYTTESAITMGLAEGEDAASCLLNDPRYRPYEYNADGSVKGDPEDKVRDVFGRVRMEYLHPEINARNTSTDVQFWWDAFSTDPSATASEFAQLGTWASRLAGNADHLSMHTYNVGAIDDVWISNGNRDPISHANAGQNIWVHTIVRNQSGLGNPPGTPIVDKSVDLRLAGTNDTVLDTKTTGHYGQVQFVVNFPGGTKCYTIQSANGVNGARACISE